MTDAVKYDLSDGIVTLTIDDPNQSANTMNETYRSAMQAAVNRLADEVAANPDSIKGVIVTSGKKTFFAGGDLKLMLHGKKLKGEWHIFRIKSDQAKPMWLLAKSKVPASPAASSRSSVSRAGASWRRILLSTPASRQ